MSEEARNGLQALETTARIVEGLCSLPAVATQNWCDRAAAALLPLGQSTAVIVMLAQIDESGRIIRQEATGVAGAYMAQVTTTIGRPQAASSTVYLDPADQTLSTLRAGLAQSKDLGWSPGRGTPGVARTGSPVTFGLPNNWRQTPPGRRWEVASPGALFLGTIALPGPVVGRAIVVEIGLTNGATPTGQEPEILSAVLPLLARRAIMAIGPNPSDGNQWLTPREQMILQHLLLGKSVREIATELERSPHTVHDHVKALHRKLNASSRGELIARALGHIQSQPGSSAASSTGVLSGSEV
jgi:DNA-binding CsgD family transcriptional regulator